ncbi:hypothetical protein M885DRAFT_156967 [Pelagophyceae sp. CCMP2097]|nr:hypothetical protein M885DRAFT_156967 [Pelagophyceae sp. CCMP2097]
MGLRGVHAGERGHAPLLRGVREHEAAAGRRGAAEGRRGASGRRGAGLGGAEGRGVVTCVVRHGDARRHPQVRRPQPLRRVGHPDDGPLRRRQALDHQLQDEDQAEPVGQSGGPDRRRRFGDARAARRAPRPDGRARHGAPRHAASLRRQALQVPDHRRLGPRGHGRSGCARRRDGVAAGEHRQRGHARHRRRSLVRRRRRGHDPTRHPRRRRREPVRGLAPWRGWNAPQLCRRSLSTASLSIGVGTALFEWARQRGASAYNSGIDDSSGSSVPMLPPELAHGEFSLNEGVARNAVTLWLMVDVPTATITSKRHERTRVVNHAAMSYAAFGALQGGPLADARELLRRLSKTFEPEDLVAWTMIEYNAYFGEVLSAKQSWPGGVLRAQADPTAAAVYAAAIGFDDATLSHVSLQLKRYAHTSSPIRRFADLINQHAVFGTAAQAFAAAGWGDSQLATLNERAVELSRYHASVDAMELAHRCRAAPRVYSGKLEVGDEGACLLVHTEKRRVRVPLHDSYFAEPIAAAVAAGAGVDGAVEVELYGVLISNRTRLRARLVGLERPKPVGFVFEEPDCASVHDGASELPTPPQSPPQPCHDSAMDKADRAMLKLPESARARGRVGRSSSESQAARYNTARCKLGPFPRSRLETGHAPTVRCGAASKHPRGGGSD